MDSVSGVGVLDKTVAVLRAVAASPSTLAQLQAATGLPRATAHRLAVALEQHGLVRRDELGRFAPGFGLIPLGRSATEFFPLAELSRPAMEVVRETTGESVQLYVREGHSRRCVVSLDSPHGLRWIVPEGVLFPLPVGSAGHLLLGEAPGPGGWLATVEEREPGVASVSAPVHDRNGQLVAAVSVSGPIERVSREPGEHFGAAVVRASRAITEAMPA